MSAGQEIASAIASGVPFDAIKAYTTVLAMASIHSSIDKDEIVAILARLLKKHYSDGTEIPDRQRFIRDLFLEAQKIIDGWKESS